MDNQHSTIGNADDNVGIPDDLRCKRSDGKQWRCTALSMPDKTVCEKHYIQAKKRAANSAMRASLKKATRKCLDEGAVHLESKSDDLDMSIMNMQRHDHRASSSGKNGKAKKRRRNLSPNSPPLRSLIHRSSSKLNDDEDMDDEYFEEKQMSDRTPGSYAMDTSRNVLKRSLDTRSTALGSSEEQSDGDTESSEDVGGSSCHQCRGIAKEVIWCLRCDRRGYCATCIATWYQDIALNDLERVCPACRGICTCRVCSRADNLIKARVKEIPVLDKLQYLHCLLSSVLPIVKRIHLEQCAEFALERNLCGTKEDLERTKLSADEQMCCDCCRVPIVDFHRHCTNCSYDLCLSCCQDLRDASLGSTIGGPLQTHATGEYQAEETVGLKFHSSRNILLLGVKFPGWRANSDGSIPCLPKQHGGCGLHSLTLRRIFKLNWVGKLLKILEEMVNGCKVKDNPCLSETMLLDSNMFQCAYREDSQDNFLYCPSNVDIKTEGIGDFRRHWIKGKPVIIEDVFENPSLPSWDPMLLWREINGTTDERNRDPNGIVTAVDCLDWSQVNLPLVEFIRGYSEGRLHKDGWPQLLKLKDWPSPSTSEEFLIYQRPELMGRLPLLEFIHSKWGILNVAAKLPHYSLQNDAGPKILISYGIQEELGSGNSVINLHLNMRDMVYLMVHSSECSLKDWPKSKTEKLHNTSEDLDIKDEELDIHKDEIQEGQGTYSVAEMLHNEKPPMMSASSPGALWDVFRREDVPKLTDYIYAHWNELCRPNAVDSSPFQITRPLYNESVYLNSHHKMRIKEEFGIEPWSFEQHVGHAVYIPAGCPFQVRNLQSTVQLAFNFLLPDSLAEAVKMSEEIRCLPNDHAAKLQMLEVGKISLYAASSAIKEVQKLVLDPKLGTELGFEDPNLTALVSVNLEKMVKQRQISCM